MPLLGSVASSFRMEANFHIWAKLWNLLDVQFTDKQNRERERILSSTIFLPL